MTLSQSVKTNVCLCLACLSVSIECSDVTVVFAYNTISVLWVNMALFEVN